MEFSSVHVLWTSLTLASRSRVETPLVQLRSWHNSSVQPVSHPCFHVNMQSSLVLANCWLGITLAMRYNQSPSYLHNLIIVEPPRSTRSSSLVTFARPPTSSSLWIRGCSFQHASRRFWNQLPASLIQPRTNLFKSDSPSPTSGSSPIGFIDAPLSSSISSSLFQSRLKTFLFCKSFPP